MPAVLAPAATTALARFELAASATFLAALRAGRPFSPRIPLRLRAWCLRWATPCEGELLLKVTLTGFRLPPRRRGQIIVRAGWAVARAIAAVLTGRAPSLIYAEDDAGLLTFEGDRRRPMPSGLDFVLGELNRVGRSGPPPEGPSGGLPPVSEPAPMDPIEPSPVAPTAPIPGPPGLPASGMLLRRL